MNELHHRNMGNEMIMHCFGKPMEHDAKTDGGIHGITI